MPLKPKHRPKPKVAAKGDSDKPSGVPVSEKEPVISDKKPRANPRAAKTQTKKPNSLANLPCIHRGEALRDESCQTCGEKGNPRTVYACGIFGECALRRWQRTKAGLKLMAACNVCEKREESPATIVTMADLKRYIGDPVNVEDGDDWTPTPADLSQIDGED